MTTLPPNKVKLTKRAVESVEHDATKRLFLWDTEIAGFNVRIYPSGRKTYFLQYRNQSRSTRKIKIGVHGNITTEQAREVAKQLSLKISVGSDPAEHKKEMKTLPTMNDLAKDYMERHASRKRPKSFREDKDILNNFVLPSFGNQKVAHLSRREIENLHLKLEHKPYRANRVLALLSKMFTLAINWGWRHDNPVKGIARYPEEKKDRWLDKTELNHLWETLDRYPQHLTAYVFKLLLLTGARKGEALQATWDQFDLDQGVWTKPSHLTKQNKKEHLPLSEHALKVLKEIKGLNQKDSIYLFPGKIEDQPLKEIKTFWKKILKEAKLENVRIHDLRHTHASHLVSSGLSLSIVGKLLGHTQASTTQRYAHLADEPLRAAAELFGRKIGKLGLKDPR